MVQHGRLKHPYSCKLPASYRTIILQPQEHGQNSRSSSNLQMLARLVQHCGRQRQSLKRVECHRAHLGSLKHFLQLAKLSHLNAMPILPHFTSAASDIFRLAGHCNFIASLKLLANCCAQPGNRSVGLPKVWVPGHAGHGL